VDCVNQRVPVIMGTGCNSTQHTITRTQKAFELGADACLVVTPYYNKPSQEGLYQHYRAVAQKAIGPVLLYNVPGRTGCDMQPSTVQRLMEFSNIVGIKEAFGNKDRYAELVTLCGPGFDIITGDDATTLDLYRAGGKGVISVTANVAPALVSAMCKAALAGNWAQASILDEKLSGLGKALFLEGNPVPVKWALQQMGKIESGIRLPLTTLSAVHHAEVKAALVQAEVL
jgi:4-hydroxy-tetrahydrodipicolinate synthase